MMLRDHILKQSSGNPFKTWCGLPIDPGKGEFPLAVNGPTCKRCIVIKRSYYERRQRASERQLGHAIVF